MGGKVPGSPGAVGYWGRDPNVRIELEQIPGKVRALLQDKLESRGKNVFLWIESTEDSPNSLICSCVKVEADKPDVTCNSCYGTGIIPGYVKFLHETLFMSSISPGLSLTNLVLDTNIKPFRLVLADNQISGSATSPRLQYSNPMGLDWDFLVDGPNIFEKNLISASFSVDGINFYALEEINDVDKKPVGLGGIYFRISLGRPTVDDRSPEFFIIRARHPSCHGPYIKILRPAVTEIPSLMQYGRRIENAAERFWTMPLDYFDPTIPVNTPLARIKENSFYARADGINAGNRFTTNKLVYDEEFGIFTHQSFETRRIQVEESATHLVF